MRREDIQNTAELRSQNKKKILEALRRHSMLTKREIADLTSLSFATVSTLSNQMEAEGFLQLGGATVSSGGRMPLLLSICEDVYFMLAINFAIANKVRMALLNLSGQRAYEWESNYTSDERYESILNLLSTGMDELLEKANVGAENIIGAVAAVPAIFDRHNRLVINSTIALYENRPMAEDLKNALHLEVDIENEANLMALACLSSKPDEPPIEDLVFLYVGEGLGIGIVSSQTLLVGAHGFGGEVSHIPLGHSGYQCYCGQTNCIETEISVSGFIRKYNQRCGTPTIDTLKPIEQQWQTYVERCLLKDETALDVARENGALLGSLTAVLVNLMDPQKVIIGGPVDQISDFLMPDIQSELLSRRIVHSREETLVHFVNGYNRLIIAGCGELTFARWNP